MTTKTRGQARSEAPAGQDGLAAAGFARPPSVLVLGANGQSLWNFRGPLLKALAAAGATVTACAPGLDEVTRERVRALGAEPVEVEIDRSGSNPVNDLRSMLAIRRMLRDRRPTTFVGYTVKPVCLGILAAAAAGVPNRVALIEGLGFAFGRDTTRQRVLGVVVRALYWLALRYAHTVVFLNDDDRSLFVKQGLVSAPKAFVVDGAGVETTHYGFRKLPPTGPITFALIARLLYDKGLREYAEAARLVRGSHPDARFLLAGPRDTNPAAVSDDELQTWADVIDYVGPVDDVRPVLEQAHVYVLPSYREGIPRTVLEAMSMGRPIIVTDAPGCRVTVSAAHRNGVLVPPRDPQALADAMMWMIEHRTELDTMGEAGRAYVQERFEAELVTQEFIRIGRLLRSPNAG